MLRQPPFASTGAPCTRRLCSLPVVATLMSYRSSWQQRHLQYQQEQQQQQLRTHLPGSRKQKRMRPGLASAAAGDLAGTAPGANPRVQIPVKPICDAGGGLEPQVVTSWLRQYLPFSLISESSVNKLAELVRVEFVTAGKVLGQEGVQPDEVVIVRQGKVKVRGSNLPVPIIAGPGACFFLIELLLSQASSTTIRTTSDAVLWVVPAQQLQELASSRPDLVLELGLKMSQELSTKVEQLESSSQVEEKRARMLQPYLVTTPKRGIIGNSRYADRLRKQIVKAARDPARNPCLIFGEPGLEKDNIAALLHFGGPDRGKPMIEVDCLTMDPFMTELFGRGSRLGLLHYIGDGTLCINNVHKAAPHMIPQLTALLESGTYQPAPAPVPLGSMDFPQAEMDTRCRIIMTAEQRIPAFDNLCTVIQVPPLRVRPADVKDLQRYYVRLLSKRQGVNISLTAEAQRQLEAYNWPNNISELKAMMERAARQSSAEQDSGAGNSGNSTAAASPAGVSSGQSSSLALDKDVFWFAAQGKDRFKWNMLTSLPLLRQVLRSDIFPELINHKIVKPVFAVVVALLFLAPQDRDHNFCLSLFWNYWWPLMFIIYPFLGRIWCSICPFMIYGEVMQRWRSASGVVLQKWPREQLDRWGGWFLFSLFAAILVWEEVWDLPNIAYLSSWLLLIITGGAVVCSAFFERRLWCRYLCPIGGMNGLFAKLSMTELRARHGVCSGTCSTYHCYKGGPAEAPEGQETLGCPLYTHPANLQDNRDCVLCMTCLKACPHRSIEVRLRLPGVDLWSNHKTSWHEVCLQFMLLGAVYLHRVDGLEAQFGLDPSLLDTKLPHIAASVAIMAVPGLVAWGADSITRIACATLATTAATAAVSMTPAAASASSTGASSGAGGAVAPAPAPLVPFQSLAYGYLPLVWGATLAFYLKSLLEEAGRIVPVTAATFGFDGDDLPVLVANHAVTEFLQGTTLLLGAGLSLLLTRKIGSKPWVTLTPHCLAVLGLTAELWYLIVH